MSKKHKILRITIALFMVLSLSLTTSKSLAYWTSEVNSPTSVTSIATVITGEWEQAFPYDSSVTYSAGDLVIRNGETYEARNDFANSLTPGSGFFWWFGWTRL